MTRRLLWALADAGALNVGAVVGPGEKGRLMRGPQKQCLGAGSDDSFSGHKHMAGGCRIDAVHGMLALCCLVPAVGPRILDANALVYVQGRQRTGTCIVVGDNFLVPPCCTSGTFLLCRLPLYLICCRVGRYAGVEGTAI